MNFIKKGTPQIDRYKKLITYLEENFKEEIDIPKIESVCHYSYRNINRIFEAIHGETIGKYIKRLRLEKAAQYLLYSDKGVTEIAFDVGFEDRAVFSKAFKKNFGKSPLIFRKENEVAFEQYLKPFELEIESQRKSLDFQIEYLPQFEYLFLEYRGAFDDQKAIDDVWNRLLTYAHKETLLSDESILMTVIDDDPDISETLYSRLHFAVLLSSSLKFEPEDLFRIKKHEKQKYAKFTHQGTPKQNEEFYKKIFAFWMTDVAFEMVDLPILEFYPNVDFMQSPNQLITEIYIPIS